MSRVGRELTCTEHALCWVGFCYSSHCRNLENRGHPAFARKGEVLIPDSCDLKSLGPLCSLHLLPRTITHVPICSHFLHAAKPPEVLFPAKLSIQLAIKLSEGKTLSLTVWEGGWRKWMGPDYCLIPAISSGICIVKRGSQLFNAELQKD